MPTRLSLLSFALLACGPSQLDLRGSIGATIRIQAPPPPPPAPAVALESETVVEFFGVPLDGAQDVIFVLDLSGSMNDQASRSIARLARPKAPPASAEPVDPNAGASSSAPNAPPSSVPPSPPPPRKVDVARDELLTALERLPAGTRMNVIFFNDGVEAFADRLVAMQEPDRAGFLSFVEGVEAHGNTALAPALRTAFVLDARRVVLLSDGHGNVGGESHEILRDAREAMQGGVRIDTIGIGPGHDRTLMQALAAESGGLYQAL